MSIEHHGPKNMFSLPTPDHRGVVTALKQHPQNMPDGVQALIFVPDYSVDGEKDPRIIPVFDSRDPSQHDLIAACYADPKKMGVAFGVGLFGAVFRVPSPRDERFPEAKNALSRFKPDRSPHDKLPIFLHPKNLGGLIDRTQVHPDFQRFVENREALEKLYEQAGAIHIIVPIKPDHPHVDPVFIHTKETWEAKNAHPDQHLDVPTVSAFYWDDPDNQSIAFATERKTPNGYMAISSFNKHTEPPAWDMKALLEFIQENNFCPFDYVVADSWNDSHSVRSSFAQIQVPLVGQDPVWRVYRGGPTDIGEYLKRIGSDHDWRMVEQAKEKAARDFPNDVDLEPALWNVMQNTAARYRERRVK
ncbi:hypothetical protein HYS00_01650 [Candidatus Microgenomates bacterium]|nr:hypothetical protein [Candidatus Microgenomates bacterium]